MDRSDTNAEFLADPGAARAPFGLGATRVAQGAFMAGVVTLGVAALSVFPHPRQTPPTLQPVRVAMAPAALPAPIARPTPLAAPPSLRPRIDPAPVRRPALAAAPAVRAPAPQRAAVIAVVAARRPPCRASHVAADRLVCSRPALASLDRRMRTAYARAIAAGADRLEIDRSQARWHGARDRATEPDQLTELYQRRIADLEAAARNPRGRAPSGGQA